MEFEEYQKEVYSEWRSRIFSAASISLFVITAVYIAMFLFFFFCGIFNEPGRSWFWYCVQRILIPLSIAVTSFIIAKSKCNKTEDEEAKNFWALQSITTVCIVITIFNNYFPIVFAVPTISVLASLSFGNKTVIRKNLRNICIGLCFAFWTFSVDPSYRHQTTFIISSSFAVVIYYAALSVFALSLSNIHKKTLSVAKESLQHREFLLNKLNLDSLTGLYNKQYLSEYLSTVIGKPNYCIAIMDLDNFKKINDGYGHLQGDEVLRQFAQIIDWQTKYDTHAFRFGGDEFVLVWKGKQDEFLAVLENIAAELKKLNFVFSKEIPLTTSIGVTAIISSDTVESVFARSDKLMYQAKNGGKDRCVNDFDQYSYKSE